MIKDKIIIRCDAGTSSDIGTGHVKRSLILIDNLIKNKIINLNDIIIMHKQGQHFNLAKQILKNSNYKSNTIEYKGVFNDATEIDTIIKSNAKFVIFDKLNTNKKLIESLKKHKKIILSLDDNGLGAKYCQYTIASLIENKYKGERHFEGYKYLILNNDLPKKKYTKKIISNITISVGGNDKRNLIKLLLLLILKLPENIEYNILVGFDKRNILENIIKSTEYKNYNINIHYNSIDYYSIIKDSDIGIVSGGITMFEYAYMGIPTVSVPQHKHQLRNIEILANKKVTLQGRIQMNISIKGLYKTINILLKSYEIRKNMQKISKKEIDGKGVIRISKLIKGIIHD